MTTHAYARYRIVELTDTAYQVEWLIGRRWSRVHDAATLADARKWLIARIADAETCA
jgi:hypothetical protein